MKNVIFGMIGCLILVYTVMISLSVYQAGIRESEMELCVSQVLRGTIEQYYHPSWQRQAGRVTDAEVESQLTRDLEERLGNSGEIRTTVFACDMEMGVISVEVEEDFPMPGGFEKEISCSRTVIVDREEDSIP